MPKFARLICDWNGSHPTRTFGPFAEVNICHFELRGFRSLDDGHDFEVLASYQDEPPRNANHDHGGWKATDTGVFYSHIEIHYVEETA